MKKNILCMMACVSVSLQATSALEKAVIHSKDSLVSQLLTGLLAKNIPLSEKKMIVGRSYQTSLDVIQEHDDTTEVWNSWSDIIKVFIGVAAAPVLLQGVYDKSLPRTLFGGLLCYLGVRGVQCKAQQHKFEAPRSIKEQLEKALQMFDKD